MPGASRPTFAYKGQRFFWGYTPDRQICGLWEVEDSNGAPHQTWPISEHAEAWLVFRSLEPHAVVHTESPAPMLATECVTGVEANTSWRKRALVGALSAVVVAGAAFGVGAFRSKPAAIGVSQHVLTAATTTEGLRSARMSMTETITGVQGAGPITVPVTGEIDFSTGDASLAMTVVGQQVSVLTAGGTLFMNIPEISQVLPGKSWVSVPEHSAGSAAGGALSGGDPMQMLKMLAVPGNTVSPLGSSTLEGTPVQGYSVSVNKSAAAAAMSSSGLPPDVVQAGEQFLQAVGPITYKVYVDAENRLKGMDFSMGVPGVSGGSLSAQAIFTDFGAPVSITTPPASQVASLQQFVYAVQQGAGGAAHV